MEHLLEVKDVTKIYEGGVLANHNVNFTVDEGEINALVGENGAGKSTLMKMLYGLESITSGHIYMKGRELKLQSSKEAIEHGIGMVHQHFMDHIRSYHLIFYQELISNFPILSLPLSAQFLKYPGYRSLFQATGPPRMFYPFP